VIIIFIDYIWIDNEPAKLGALPGDIPVEKLDVAWRWTMAGVLSCFIMFGGLLFSMTDTYILVNSKPGECERQLREWLITQLMWADNGRLGMMRMVRHPALCPSFGCVSQTKKLTAHYQYLSRRTTSQRQRQKWKQLAIAIRVFSLLSNESPTLSSISSWCACCVHLQRHSF